MLNLILGRAGTGKTASVLNDIRLRMEAGESGLLLIVPEQYSHDAERQLCDVCGDALSMHGETLSFTRLCGRVFFETGAPVRMLDGGGQMLVMHRAIESAAQRLKVFGTKGSRVELLEKMLDTVKEFKSLNISPESLEHIASIASDPLAGKLQDLSLIYDAYNALLHVHGGDTADRLTMLAELIGDSTVGDAGHIYFDGFNDFTVQEFRVIEELLRKNAEITVCLSCDLHDGSEVFELPRKTADRLNRLAEKYSIEVKTEYFDTSTSDASLPTTHPKASELCFIEKHLFNHAQAKYSGQCDAISLFSAPSRYAECECAANKVLELVRSGYRWRDISIMARNWEEYSSICENVFEKYRIPFFSGGRADILSKPPIALIIAALDIAVTGWEYRQVFSYIKTGLTDLSAEESAELENYVLKWNIRGSLWAREWILPPAGYGDVADSAVLENINSLRRRVSEPLFKLRDGVKGASEASEKLRALFSFLEEIKLPERLGEKTIEFEKRGEKRLADEYSQLWDVIINAMEQVFDILGDTKLSATEFGKVLTLVLSRYDVGVIPVSLDRTALGEMAMSRRRDMKCLIVLGASDDNIPLLSKGGGTLSDSDREEMAGLGADIPSGLEERFCREMNMLYSALTLPSEELVVTYPTAGGTRPSFIIKRLKAMFGSRGTVHSLPREEANEPSPCFPERGSLSSLVAERLYGRELSLSPTRVDKYYSCPYQHFLQSGLRLRPRIPAEFDAPAAGIFIHYVLERVSREIKETVGYKNAQADSCSAIVARYIRQYVKEILLDFEGKDARFIYLFRRLEADVMRIALDMLEELSNSDFEPLDFELDFTELMGNAPQTLPVSLSGTVDRVDGWQRGDKLYLRVIDYKTGKKSFELSDVIYGRNLQMLIYLFALKEYGHGHYGRDIASAGVLYVPARDFILKASRSAPEESLKKLREKELRRGGLILNDPLVIDAMDLGSEKKYLPVKLTKEGAVTGDNLVSPGQIEVLSKHVGRMLGSAAEKILDGNIECRPYYRSDNDNACMYCEYATVCGFDEEAGDRPRFVRKLKADEVWEALSDDR